MRVLTEHRVSIRSDADIVVARQKGRQLATELGFSTSDATLVATTISELARNIVTYARSGEIDLQTVENSKEQNGIQIVARDEGPGIRDLRQALLDGYSTSGSLGLGLPGVRRLMDEFDVSSELGKGTTVRVTKWQR